MEPSKLHKSTVIAQSTDAVGPILPVKINVESCPVTAVRHSRPLCHMKHSTKLQSEPGQCVKTFTQVYVLSIEEPEKAGPMGLLLHWNKLVLNSASNVETAVRREWVEKLLSALSLEDDWPTTEENDRG